LDKLILDFLCQGVTGSLKGRKKGGGGDRGKDKEAGDWPWYEEELRSAKTNSGIKEEE